MDLTKFLGQDTQEQSAQRLSKEEYAAQKKQEREELWGMIDGKAQEVFQNGDSLKGFLDFMGQCKPQRTDNLFLLYAQNPEIRQVKTFEKWKEEGKVVKTGSKGYNFIVGQEYEKDGVIQQGYSIQKAYDISQIRTKQPEEAEPKPMDQLMEALLTDSEVRIQIADNLPDKVQAQYIPNKRTIYVRNGMSKNATFHSISRELACASLDHHDGSYSRAGVSAQAYCAAYVTAQKYGVDVSGFSFDKVCQMQAFGQKDPKELRSFIQDVKSAAYSIGKQVDRNLGCQSLSEEPEKIIAQRETLLKAVTEQRMFSQAAALVEKYAQEVFDELQELNSSSGQRQGMLAMDYIQKNYMDPGLSLNSICSYLNISTSYFSTIFKEMTGETFIEVLTRVRMEKAKELLENTTMKNYEIAEKVGFSDPHYFGISFKKITGKTPTEYAREKRR